ncbi:MAG: hypothetical protein IPJ65_28355 [Archangiaceae bacterium]|nr:hypothetical protein [Archangiaceae bacterium]
MFDTDDSAWPVVTVTWQGALSDDELREFLSRLDGWLARNERFGLLLDSRAGKGSMNGRQRQMLLAHLDGAKEQTGRLMVQAIVHEQPLHRALYAAVSFVYPLPFPSKTFPEPESARLWLEDKLSSRRAS